MVTRVLIDADVLFSRATRDWVFLCKLATGGRMFTLAYTEDVLAEAIARLRDRRPDISGGSMAALADRVRSSCEERIEDYDPRWSPLADVDDGHVHAAAVAGGVHTLLTNDTGFQRAARATDLPYEVYTADDFLLLVGESDSSAVDVVIDQQIDYFHQRAMDYDLEGRLRDADCPQFADFVLGRLRRRALRR